MATQAELDDALYNLRLCTTSNITPILSTTDNPTSGGDTVTDLSLATHIFFPHKDSKKAFPLSEPTRFAAGDAPVTLRSVFFAWQNKDASLPDYITKVQALNEDLPAGAGGSVQNLSFAQKIELIAWLGGETESIESIRPLEGAGLGTDAEHSAAIASGKTGVAIDKGGPGGKKAEEARLLVIYEGERKMGDHNTVLRGTKPTDFSPYRKIAASFLRSRPNNPNAPSTSAPHPHPSPLISSLQKKPKKREEPIILLSPSASSLLRMSNVKSFLDDGTFIPPNTAEATTSSNMLYLTRVLPSISSVPLRFILVDSTAQFKPPYWARVVAIFTTGQTWQFKSYKYPNAVELFAHYPGVFVGYQGDETPEAVQAWGKGVLTAKVDKWTGGAQGRWRDREVVETIWGRIEEGMRRGGWTKDGPGLSGGSR
ncbi:RNA pol II accessory factor, Cdc73 family-domain-containing protein [Dendryphion nanum]|uniref:RNA pol II accessory factor, Cdc73 family-domain-containing protein n=1 Tax=Dendryphion nanum TaxID=256645 RepID=A0A9P9DL44_9PLEO|nr:RNA pol II accessory factor, Cdc73 family-domain-containing protein [Dendryphion nanum]